MKIERREWKRGRTSEEHFHEVSNKKMSEWCESIELERERKEEDFSSEGLWHFDSHNKMAALHKNNNKKNKRGELDKTFLDAMSGSGEKNYWKCFKEVLGMNKKEERVPEEVWEGEELVRGGRVKQVWNAAFSKLGKFDLNDKKFDRKKYEEVRKKLEQYERNVQSKVVRCRNY